MGHARRSVIPLALTASLVGACIAISEGTGVPKKITDLDDGGTGSFVLVDATGQPLDARIDLATTDPHAVLSVTPSHGRFSGGQQAVVRGNGFSSQARIWFGSAEVPSDQVVRASPTMLQAVIPPGDPGRVSVTVQNGDDASTARTLKEAYVVDPFYADPSAGPTSGGTRIVLHGKNTSWDAHTAILVGRQDCSNVDVVSPTEIHCAVPSHPTGSVSITVSSDIDGKVLVEDAFVYSDSDNGYKGGLSGSTLNGTLRVAVFDAYTGVPALGARVIAGDSLGSALQRTVGGSGVVVFTDLSLTGTRSVTVAKKCYEPMTFVDVPVDTVTVYLSPILSPACGADAGDIPPVGGRGTSVAEIRGQLVWTGGVEFKRADWTNVPAPKSPNEKRAAYVFAPSSDPVSVFHLPDPTTAVRPDAPGAPGYKFVRDVLPGNTILYALAGIENRNIYPPIFAAYAFGMVKGIATLPNQVTSDVFIPMDKSLDQAIALTVTPPVPGPRGPDRVVARVAVQLENGLYAIFPNAARTVPIATTIPYSFVGLPGLDGVLTKTAFVSSASATTGINNGVPLSIVGKYLTTDASINIAIDGFVQVPVLTTPASSGRFDGTHLEFDTAPAGASIDLTVVRVAGSGGLVEWVVAVPGAKRQVILPDIGSLGIGLPSGPVDIRITCAHIDPFNYANLLYRHLDSRGWNAYSQDVFHVHY